MIQRYRKLKQKNPEWVDNVAPRTNRLLSENISDKHGMLWVNAQGDSNVIQNSTGYCH